MGNRIRQVIPGADVRRRRQVARHLQHHHHRKRWYQYAVRRGDRALLAGLHRHDAPTLAAGLRDHACPLLAIALVGGVATLVLVYRRLFAAARFPAVAAVGSVITGWGVGQYPWMLVDTLTISEAAGAGATLQALLIVVALAVVIVLPSLGYLLWLTQTEQWTRS